MRTPNPSPTLDKNLASMGPEILSSIGVGVWRKAPEVFPDSNTTLDTFQPAIGNQELQNQGLWERLIMRSSIEGPHLHQCTGKKPRGVQVQYQAGCSGRWWRPANAASSHRFSSASLDEGQITHLICARLKYDLYDFFRAASCCFPYIKGPKTTPKKVI